MKRVLVILVALLSPLNAYPYCFEEAAIEYGVNPIVLQAISKVESGYRINAVHTNKNGSEDRGHMQINDYWTRYLGAGWSYLTQDPCYCTKVGAWILKQCMNRYGNTWNAIACYNAGKAPNELPQPRRMLAIEYIQKVKRAIQ